LIFYSIVIPIFRADEVLFKLYENIALVIEKKHFEVILVFDSGEIKSMEICEELCSNQENVICLKLSRNFGQHNALLAGIELAKGNWVITLDEDFQHDPVEIPKLIEQQRLTGAKVVYGEYKIRKHNKFRNTTSWLLKKLLSLGIPELYPNYTAYRLIDINTAKSLLKMNNSYTFLDGYLSWVTNSFSHVHINHRESLSKTSAYSTRKLIAHSINIFVTFSSIPIRFLTIISFILFFLSCLYSIWIIVNSLINAHYQSGFPTIMAFLGFGFGFVLLGIGIIGEYIYKISLKSTNRPNYIVEKIIN
jgi:glycosyltransferase involved in cell wall biosynthesis